MSDTAVRLAELLGGLSLACDVADGFPPEKVLRTTLLATELGRRHGLDDEVVRDIYFTSLFRYTGCTGFAHEEAHTYGAGDDIATQNKEIAVALGISPRTAQHHVIHIYRKIDVSSRAAAALFATEHGLLEPDQGGRRS